MGSAGLFFFFRTTLLAAVQALLLSTRDSVRNSQQRLELPHSVAQSALFLPSRSCFLVIMLRK